MMIAKYIRLSSADEDARYLNAAMLVRGRRGLLQD